MNLEQVSEQFKSKEANAVAAAGGALVSLNGTLDGVDKNAARGTSFDSVNPALLESQIQGVAPGLLISQIRNTIPFLWGNQDTYKDIPYVRAIFDAESQIAQSPMLANLDASGWLEPVSYYKLCISAHWATVGSFVPTDVDTAIRFKLWNQRLTDEELSKMVDVSLEALAWPIKSLTRRFIEVDGEILSGHQGEWFSIIAAAYGVLKRSGHPRALEIQESIIVELKRQENVFNKVKKNRDGRAILAASYLLAHNFGDLTRVLDQWKIADDDQARVSQVIAPSINAEIEKLNTDIIAPENHRHLSLRHARPLRVSEDFLLPICPFLDDWGKTLSRHPSLEYKDIVIVIEALVEGWKRLKNPTQSYPRALSGIIENCKGGFKQLSKFMPARLERELSQGVLRNMMSISKQRFEDQWARLGLKF